ncbi:MAG: hypothetical protein NC909_00950, partial [Candidatus Omnitrophica bacterium]|nr:hypothetical protein [Candidatus Omnitrophota bacterium]
MKLSQSQSKNIKVFLITRPYIGEFTEITWWKTYAPLYRSVIIEVGSDNTVPVLHIYSYFKDKEEFFIEESHFNEEG